jgi:hypothetical protein
MRVGFDRIKLADIAKSNAGGAHRTSRSGHIELPEGASIVSMADVGGWLSVYWTAPDEEVVDE